MTRGKTIERLYAWICTERDGTEGIPAISSQFGPMPLVGADKERIESFRPVAMEVRRERGLPVRLVEFTGMMILESHSAPAASPSAAPGYWMHEVSGELRPVVEAYLAGAELDAEQRRIMRAYLHQWIHGPFRGAEVDTLRREVDRIADMKALRAWLAAAGAAGVDPL